jgi:hypothetical protein
MQITNEQFNELCGLLRTASGLVRESAFMTDSIFRLMPKQTGRACVCKMTDDLGKAWDIFFKISDLLEKVKKGETMIEEDSKNQPMKDGEK